MDAEPARAVADRQTDTQDNYFNPCPCAPSVNENLCTFLSKVLTMTVTQDKRE